MSAIEYLKQSAQKLADQPFKNGTIKLELCPSGIVIRGVKELPAHEGMLTYCDRVVAWILLESALHNVLDTDITSVVEQLELEASNAGN